MSVRRTMRVAVGTRAHSGLRAALGRWQTEVIGMDDVDLATTEMVRLRAARHHDCHT